MKNDEKRQQLAATAEDCANASFILHSGILHSSFDDSRRAHQFAFDLVQDAIDEFTAVLSGEFFGDIHGLVDADDGRDVVAV